MIIKMMITFDYDPETNEYKPIKQEIIKDKAKDPALELAEEAKESGEPQLTLASNKYILNQAAADLIGVKYEDKLDIKYQLIDSIRYPIIGSNISWKTSGGNKLTKSLTVSCRGNANNLLSEFGDTFSLSPWQGHPGLFILIGNKDREIAQDDNIEVKENPETEIDIQEETFTDEDSFNLEDENFEEDDFELKDLNFDFDGSI